jgi:hypothetical protein
MAATAMDQLNEQCPIGPLQCKKTLLTAAEWKVLNATQKGLVPSPGPGRAILFERAYINIIGGTTAGDTDGDLSIRYTGGTGDDVSQAQDDFLNDSTKGGLTMPIERIGTESTTQTLGYLQENLGLELYSASDLAGSAGDFTLEVVVFYRLVRMAVG